MVYPQEGDGYSSYPYHSSAAISPGDLSGIGSSMQMDFEPPRLDQADLFSGILGSVPRLVRSSDEPWSVEGVYARPYHQPYSSYPDHALTEGSFGAHSPGGSIVTTNTDVSTNFNGPSQSIDIARTTRQSRRPHKPSKSVTSDPPRVTKQRKRICPKCKVEIKMNSEYRKHMLRHEKPFKCEVLGCTRNEGFTTPNDLSRHLMTVHKVFSGDHPPKVYRCASTACKSKPREWTRLDNFRQHVHRTHPLEDKHDLIKRSETYADVSALDMSQANTDVPSDTNQAVALQGRGGPRLQIPQTKTPLLREPPDSPYYFTQSPGSIPPYEPTTGHVGPSVQSDTASVQSSPVDRYKGSAGDTRTSQSQSATSPIYSAGSQSNNSSEALSFTSPPTDVSHAGKRLKSKPSTPQQLQPLELMDMNPDSHVERYSVQLAQLMDASMDKGALQTNITHLLSQFKIEVQSERRSTSNGYETRDGFLLPPTQATKRSRSQSDGSRPRSFEAVDPSLRDHKAEEKEAMAVKGLKSPPRRESNSTGPLSCQEPGCTRKFLTNAALKKHMRRHDRPFGCTFDSCYKKFGSKNDWKRHENSQHFQVDVWRCEETRPGAAGDIKCGKVYYRREIYTKHLEQAHDITAPTELTKNVKHRRVEQFGKTSFWCGFCKKLQKLNSCGLRAWDERFNHIGEHFTKHGKNIDEWQSYSTKTTKAKMLQDERRGFRPSEGEAESDKDDSAHRTSSASKSPLNDATFEEDEHTTDETDDNRDAVGDPDYDNQPQDVAMALFGDAIHDIPTAPSIPLKPKDRGQGSSRRAKERYCCCCGCGPQNPDIDTHCQHCAHELNANGSCCISRMPTFNER